MGAYLLLFPTAKMQYVSYGHATDVPAWVFLGLWIAKQFYFATHPGRYGHEHVAFWAHVGGFVSGVLLSWCLLKLGLAIVNDDAADRAQP